MVSFAGEDVPAVVLEVGSHSTRVGYAGDDQPKVVFPTAVGIRPTGPPALGDLTLAYPHEKMEVVRPLEDDALLEHVWRYALEERLKLGRGSFPLMVIDHNGSKEARERLVRLAFDKFEVPAIFVGRGPVLAAFSQGKPSALVVDIGASAVTITPVYDGHVVRAGIVKQAVGGDFLSDQCLCMLDELEIPIHIPQQIAKKTAVDIDMPAVFEERKLNLTESFRQYHLGKVLEEFKEAVIQVSETKLANDNLARPPRYFEFPDGRNQNFGLERYRVGETLFNPNEFMYQPAAKAMDIDADQVQASSPSLMGIVEMILKSVQLCDSETRMNVLSHIVVVGGGSLVGGFVERLTQELANSMNNVKIRVHAATGSAERKLGAWVGASILASLGSFQQLWLTRQEYAEHGASYIERKCL